MPRRDRRAYRPTLEALEARYALSTTVLPRPTPHLPPLDGPPAPSSGQSALAVEVRGTPFSAIVASFPKFGAVPGTAVVNWGDGITSAGLVVATNAGYTVWGNHTYSTVGVFTVTVTVLPAGVEAGHPSTASGTRTYAGAIVVLPSVAEVGLVAFQLANDSRYLAQLASYLPGLAGGGGGSAPAIQPPPVSQPVSPPVTQPISTPITQPEGGGTTPLVGVGKPASSTVLLSLPTNAAAMAFSSQVRQDASPTSAGLTGQVTWDRRADHDTPPLPLTRDADHAKELPDQTESLAGVIAAVAGTVIVSPALARANHPADASLDELFQRIGVAEARDEDLFGQALSAPPPAVAVPAQAPPAAPRVAFREDGRTRQDFVEGAVVLLVYCLVYLHLTRG
jgi:hypothetical protein